jgi:bifunctional non-homologous end joining protein LigD
MPRTKKTKSTLRSVCEGAKEAPQPLIIQPMLATLVDKPFSDPEWLFETKWDGIRAICFIKNGKARFVSRNQNDLSAQYPELSNIGNDLDATEAVLDGEIVALDEHGVSRFQLLQSRMGRKNQAEIARLVAKTRLAYYVFDLLHLDGVDLTGCALIDRKTTLERILKTDKLIRYSDHIIEHGVQLYDEIAKVPLEGVIAKHIDSAYAQRRSREWLKIKTILEAEVVIGGYTEPRKSRSYFGALVVGLYEGGELRYVGHAGGGFNEKSLEQLYKLMQPLKTKLSPFADKIQTNEPVQWIKPKVVVQVKFAEWTADRRMRQPIFLGVREDKPAKDVSFEVKRETEDVIDKRKPARKRRK